MTKITKRQRRNLRKQGIDLKTPEIQSNIMAIKRIAPLTDNQEKVFDSYDADQNLMISGYAGTGKRILNSEKILTDSGWKLVGDVTLKDRLVAVDGTYTKILGIYPQETGTIYEVSFDDGCSLKVDGEHLWSVKSGKDGHRQGFVVKSTRELIEKMESDKWYIPLITGPAPGVSNNFDDIDTYIVGLMLGDGTMQSNHPTIYTNDEFIRDYLKDRGWNIYRYDYSTTWMATATNKNTKHDISILDTLCGKEKRIPEELLLASPEKRLELLRGLMDSDGTIQKDGSCSFASISEGLARGVQYLVRSLGGKSKVRIKKRLSHRGGQDWHYHVSVLHCNKFNPFKLPRKALRIKARRKGQTRTIVGIKEIGDGAATCFMVEHPSKLFVCQDFIVTHNTFISMGLALEQILSGKSPYKKLIIVRSAVATRDIGFLPGNAKEKTSVYEAPYASNAAKLFGRADAYEILKSKGIIEFMPTSYVRGITCDNAIILVDELQNLSYHESSSIITRAGEDCRYILVGDYRQSDLRGKEKEDVKKIIRICSIMPSFDFVEMGADDIVRSGLVREFILASEKIESDLQA